MTVETREIRRGQVRAKAGGKPGVTLKVITPYVVDDYGSCFMPDTFDESLAKRGPVLCWSHDWEDPLGPYVGHRKDVDGTPIIDFLFSSFDAVPRARQAHAQVLDGTIRDCSVGFSNTQRRKPTDAEAQKWPGVREIITKADLDEVSLVVRGAVPGATVLDARRRNVSQAQRVLDAEMDAALDLALGRYRNR